MKHVWAGGANRSRKRTRSSFHRGLAAACISISLAAAPITGALAGNGVTGVQFEIALGKTAKLRQVNLAFQNDISPTQGFTFERVRQTGIAIPLYSVNPRTPGLLNHLNASGATEKGKSKATAGGVIGVVLAVGILGLVAYAAGKCLKETTSFELDQSRRDDKGCKALSSGGGGLGGLS